MSEIVLPGRVNEVDDQRCYTQDEHQHYLERGDNANINNSSDDVGNMYTYSICHRKIIRIVR